MDRFIVDAGPFIHLEQINQLKLLKKLPKLFVPASVLAEINQGTIRSRIETIKNWPNMNIIAAGQKGRVSINTIIERANLQRGEIDCIRLAGEISGGIFLTDDLTARTTAEKLSIEVHGSVGIIAYAFRRKWLSLKEAETSLIFLYERSNLFITRAIIEGAISSLRKSV